MAEQVATRPTGRPSDEWMRLADAAKVAGVCRTTLHYAAARGEILWAWTPHGRVFLRGDVEAWAAGR